MILLQIFGTYNVSLMLLSLAVILISILYAFLRGRASLSILIACVVLFLFQQISLYLGEFPDLTFALSNPLWMVYERAYDILIRFLPKNTTSALALEIAKNPFIFIGSLFAPLSSMYLHGDVWHILMNMLFLFFIGAPLEQRIGSKNFMVVYLVSGLVGSFCQYATGFPGIGASGALMGIFGAFAYLYPHERFIAFPLLIPMPASVLLIFFIAMDAIYQLTGAQANIAHLAHIGGVLGGIATAYFLSRRGTTGRIKKERKLNVYGLYTINNNLDAIQDAAREEIPEIRKAKVEAIVGNGICPECGSKPEIKGANVVCRHCGYNFSLYE